MARDFAPTHEGKRTKAREEPRRPPTATPTPSPTPTGKGGHRLAPGEALNRDPKEPIRELPRSPQGWWEGWKGSPRPKRWPAGGLNACGTTSPPPLPEAPPTFRKRQSVALSRVERERESFRRRVLDPGRVFVETSPSLRKRTKRLGAGRRGGFTEERARGRRGGRRSPPTAARWRGGRNPAPFNTSPAAAAAWATPQAATCSTPAPLRGRTPRANGLSPTAQTCGCPELACPEVIGEALGGSAEAPKVTGTERDQDATSHHHTEAHPERQKYLSRRSTASTSSSGALQSEQGRPLRANHLLRRTRKAATSSARAGPRSRATQGLGQGPARGGGEAPGPALPGRAWRSPSPCRGTTEPPPRYRRQPARPRRSWDRPPSTDAPTPET